MSGTRHVLRSVALGCIPVALTLASSAAAQTSGGEVILDQRTRTLDEALREVGRQSGREIMYPADAVAGRPAPSLPRPLSPEEAVLQLLSGTGLSADFQPGVILIRGRGDTSDGAPAASDVVVTGTRIRGADLASPQIVTSARTIRAQGFPDLGSFTRSLPQAFSGGQNPGVVGSGQQGESNANVTSSSALNLRGLGPDATLTLIAGHRVAFDAASQGIDISAVPLLAVDRLEIVTDGASAVYGSDAVGGVANIILRRDLDSLITNVRVGSTTDGGAAERQASAALGQRWSSGSLLLAGEYRASSAIRAGQRSFTMPGNASAILLPKQEQVSGVAALHQQVTPALTFDLDAEASQRDSRQGTPFLVDQPYDVFGFRVTPRVRAFAVSPSLTLALADDWTATVAGTHSRSRTTFVNQTILDGAEASRVAVLYGNRLSTLEFSTEGRLIDAPGGPVRFSAGGGLRNYALHTRAVASAGGASQLFQEFDRGQHVRFGYAELFVPLVSDANAAPLLQQLSASAALRYEDYRGIGDVFNPRAGLVWRPGKALALRASYGRSFKAPTLYQLYQLRNGGILPASIFGDTSGDPTRAVAFIAGGNPMLRPERATTWSISSQFTPPALPGLTLDADYYRIRFKQRVVNPILSFRGILTNPLYADLVTLNPDAAQLAAIAATLPQGLVNQTGAPLETLQIVAFIDDLLRNAAQQVADGVDVTARYDVTASAVGHLAVNATASYLRLRQQLGPLQPTIALAGTIYQPPHWRGRASVDWDRDAFGLTAAATYIGGVEDRRSEPVEQVRSFLSFDLVGRARRPAGGGVFDGIEGSIAFLNILNRKPDRVRPSDPSNPTFDSTNYPALGRSVSLSVTKRW